MSGQARGEEASGMSNKSERKVTFLSSHKENEEYLDSDEESFYEITTSKPDSVSSSDNNDAEKLELVLQSAYACSSKKHRRKNEPVFLVIYGQRFHRVGRHESLSLTTCLLLFSCKLDISSSSEFDSYSESNYPSCDESLTGDTSYHTWTAMPVCTGVIVGVHLMKKMKIFQGEKGVNTVVRKIL